MNIKELIGETTQYDKKTALETKKPKSWCKSVSAFANTYGGKLIFGITDNNEIVGLQDPENDAEYSGSVISLNDNGEAFIKRNAKKMWRKTANSREEMPEYVERSYHEALVNAIAHRDYLIYGSEVHIDIF
jgi:predicted HTH transcriptional regulator